jgi:translation initiation factor IF-2
MDKVKIQEIADEAGLSNADLLDKAKELGFDVKAANSTISMENAGILSR